MRKRRSTIQAEDAKKRCPNCDAENLTDYPLCPSCAAICHFDKRKCHCEGCRTGGIKVSGPIGAITPEVIRMLPEPIQRGLEEIFAERRRQIIREEESRQVI